MLLTVSYTNFDPLAQQTNNRTSSLQFNLPSILIDSWRDSVNFNQLKSSRVYTAYILTCQSFWMRLFTWAILEWNSPSLYAIFWKYKLEINRIERLGLRLSRSIVFRLPFWSVGVNWNWSFYWLDRAFFFLACGDAHGSLAFHDTSLTVIDYGTNQQLPALLMAICWEKVASCLWINKLVLCAGSSNTNRWLLKSYTRRQKTCCQMYV